MVYKFLFCVTPLFFFSHFIFSQTITGKILNEQGVGIENANIIFQDSIGNTIAFGFSMKDGSYSISLKNNLDFFYLTVNAFNYESIRQQISNATAKQNFTLKGKVIELKEIYIKPPPINTTGDTINYDVDFFKKPQNRVIGDVLKNIPGIVINDKGAISYNGIYINKFYIDGDDILGGKYNLAENTIPADLVKSVQVLERHQPIEVLRNIIPSQQPALNLKLKDAAKLKLVGEAELAAGNHHNYVANTNTMLLKNKLKTINRLAFNSAANNLVDELEDHSLENLFENFNLPFSSPSYNYQNIQDPIIGMEPWQDNYTGSVNFNTLAKLKNKQSIRINIGYIPQKTIRNYEVQTVYSFGNQIINQYENQELYNKNHLVKGDFVWEKNNENIFIKNKFSTDFDLNAVSGTVLSNYGNFTQFGVANKSKITNDFRLVKVLFKHIIINYKNYVGYQKYPELLKIDSNRFILNEYYLNKDLNQNILKNTFFINQKLSFGFNSKKISQNYIINVDYDTGNFTQSILSNNQYLNENYRNNLMFNKLHNNFEANYNLNMGKFKFNMSLPLTLDLIKYKDRIKENSIDTNLVYITPRFNLDFNFKAKNKLGFNVYHSFAAGSPNELLNGGILQNFRSIVTNNFMLNIVKTNSIGIDYSYNNIIKATNFTTSISYSKTDNNVILKSQINTDGSLTFLKIPFKNHLERLLANITFQKYWFALSTNFKPSVNISINKMPQFINGVLIRNISKNVGIDFFIDSRVSKKFNFSIYAMQQFTQSNVINSIQYPSLTTYFATYKTNFAYVISDEFSFESITNYNFINGENQKNDFLLSDFKLTFTSKKSKNAYIIGVDNAFNSKTLTNQSLNVNSYITENYFIRPRIFYFKIKFLI